MTVKPTPSPDIFPKPTHSSGGADPIPLPCASTLQHTLRQLFVSYVTILEVVRNDLPFLRIPGTDFPQWKLWRLGMVQQLSEIRGLKPSSNLPTSRPSRSQTTEHLLFSKTDAEQKWHPPGLIQGHLWRGSSSTINPDRNGNGGHSNSSRLLAWHILLWWQPIHPFATRGPFRWQFLNFVYFLEVKHVLGRFKKSPQAGIAAGEMCVCTSSNHPARPYHSRDRREREPVTKLTSVVLWWRLPRLPSCLPCLLPAWAPHWEGDRWATEVKFPGPEHFPNGILGKITKDVNVGSGTETKIPDQEQMVQATWNLRFYWNYCPQTLHLLPCKSAVRTSLESGSQNITTQTTPAHLSSRDVVIAPDLTTFS